MSNTFLYTRGILLFIQLTTSLDADIDVPPMAKKLSSAKTSSSPNTSAKMSQSFFSISLDGISPAFLLDGVGTGSFLLSTLLLTFSGILGICMVTDGTMYGGFLAPMKA